MVPLVAVLLVACWAQLSHAGHRMHNASVTAHAPQADHGGPPRHALSSGVAPGRVQLPGLGGNQEPADTARELQARGGSEAQRGATQARPAWPNRAKAQASSRARFLRGLVQWLRARSQASRLSTSAPTPPQRPAFIDDFLMGAGLMTIVSAVLSFFLVMASRGQTILNPAALAVTALLLVLVSISAVGLLLMYLSLAA